MCNQLNDSPIKILIMRKITPLVFMLSVLFPLNSGYSYRAQASERIKPFSNSHFIEINKQTLHYRIWTPEVTTHALPGILMIHGMGGSTFSWEYNAPILAAAGYQVIAVDVPPFGYSDKDPDINQSIDSRSQLLWEFINRIQPDKRWHLIGHSMGGGIVQGMAIINPVQVEKVVFVDPALFRNNKTDKSHANMPLFRLRSLEWLAIAVGKTTLIRPKGITKMLRSAYAQEPNPADVEEYYKALSEKGTARALIRSTAVSKPVKEIDGLKFNKPAIAIWGDLDSWVPLTKSQPILDQLPSIKVIVIKGAGHCPMATHPNHFNELVIGFLQLTGAPI
jgi:2-hydroxy-6-oxonona-2,4-dienedioate hydrolase